MWTCSDAENHAAADSRRAIILLVEEETVNKLLEINRIFYSQFSDDFSDSRSGDRLDLDPFRHYLSDGIRLLDIGCGNGRLAVALEKAGFALDYFGIDGSAELVAFANSQADSFQSVRAQFHVANLVPFSWRGAISHYAPFDVILSLAVLHHIPSFDLRSQIITEIRSLLKPGGIFVMSNWQFTHSDRLRKKIRDWSQVGLDPTQLDPDDYLLDWKRGGTGYRYVHLVTESEGVALARSAHMNVLTQFYADNDLNLYSIFRR